MSVLLRCPQGHQWESAAGPHSPSGPQPVCPVCGALPETPAPDETMLTLGGRSSPPATGIAPHAPLQPPHRTGPAAPPETPSRPKTPAPGAFEKTEMLSGQSGPGAVEGPRPEASGASAAGDQSSGTLPLPATLPGGGPAPGEGRHAADVPDTRILTDELLSVRRAAQPAVPWVAGYEVLGELGRGGMGVVYLARQTDLNRLVALKVIRSGAHAGPEELARFFTEAEVVALLQHPNIVQIFQVGRDLGQPFCALEYVEGGSLQQKLNGTPLPARQAARLLEAMADAVQAAHEKGVVHRDLKPANVLLTKDGTPKITDFGLAKVLAEEAASAQTRTGAIMGTPSYMAPEQARGQTRDIGPAADIYSLGAVLYDVLTGRPPFQGETALDTLQLVHSSDPVPPARLQPKVPRDLETICLTCLQKEPEKRYDSARALRDDLRRFLDGEPIRARPVSAWERARKWARRKPAAAAVVALSALLVLGLIAGGYAFGILESRRANRERELRAEAERQGRRAEGNFLLAREAVDQMLTRVGRERLANEPRMERVRRDLLTRALRFYEGFLSERGDDPRARWDTGRAYQRVGDIQEMLGDHPAAEKAYRSALAFFDELAAEFPDQPEYRQHLAGTRGSLAVVLQAAGRRDEAVAAFRQAIATQQELAAAYPDAHQYKRDLAASYQNRANLLLTRGQTAEAEKAYAEAIAHLGRLADKFPGQPVYRHELARAHSSLGVLLLDARPADAGEAFRQALELQEPLAERHADVADYRHELARILFLRGNWLQTRDRLPEADRSYGRAEGLFRRLVQSYPGVPDYQHGLATCLANHGELHRVAGRPADGEPLLGEAVERFAELAKEYPEAPGYRQELARGYHKLGVLLNGLDRNADAEKAHRRALAERQQLAEAFPREPAYRQELAYSHGELAIVLAKANRHAGSEENFRKAIALLERLQDEDPGTPAYWRDEVTQQNNLTTLLSALGRHRDAEVSCRRVVELHEKLADAFPAAPEHKHNLGQTLHNLAGLLLEQNKRPPARECLLRAVREQRAALKLQERPVFRQALCLHHQGLAEVALAAGDHADAARAVADLVKAVPDDWPDYPRAAAFLAKCIPLAAGDKSLPEPKCQALAREYGDRAMDLLRRAAARGYKDVNYLRRSPDFEPLRPRDDFQKLLSELAGPSPRDGDRQSG